MRLKFLFFPIMLVISVAVFIGFIWPEIGNVKSANEAKLAKNAELRAIKDKQSAIESIGKKISENVDGETVVNNYLPENKAEERIISGVNYLAGDANVSLVNISLNSVKSATALTTDTPVGLAGTAAPLIDPITGQPIASSAVSNASSKQVTSAKIALIGDYEKIRIFLDSLQRMPILNTIKSLEITKQESKNAEDGANDTTLSVNVDVDFGYMAVSKIDNKQVENFKTALDNETIDSLKKYISQKSQSIGGENDLKGKTNPFLAN